MPGSLEMEAEEAYQRVDRALDDARVEFRREGLRYEIPNFGSCFERVVSVADQALSGTPYYAQEMPYREVQGQIPDHMLVLHRDDRQ